jgi:hypothetical protein
VIAPLRRTPLSLVLTAGLALGALSLASCGRDAADEAQAGTSSLERVDPSIEAEQISWRDLMPDDELDALEALNEGRADPSLMSRFTGSSPVENQIGTFNVVEELAGAVVRMPGYILPLDYAQQGSAREFLLLPYHGACVHYPPPPPNQIVYLRSPDPIEYSSLWEPVWVEGRMEIERVDTELAAAAYTLIVRSVSEYQP